MVMIPEAIAVLMSGVLGDEQGEDAARAMFPNPEVAFSSMVNLAGVLLTYLARERKESEVETLRRIAEAAARAEDSTRRIDD